MTNEEALYGVVALAASALALSQGRKKMSSGVSKTMPIQNIKSVTKATYSPMAQVASAMSLPKVSR